MRFKPSNILLCVCFCGLAIASPQLRLSTSAAGPIFIVLGQNGPDQTVTATNLGTGSLALTASSNVAWLAPTVVSSTVRISLNTASLTRGTYTGVVTVSDPNAIDAPQTITVTAQIGSEIPDSIDLYLPPGGSANFSFTTGTVSTATVAPPANGATLSIAPLQGGIFGSAFAYELTAAAPAGTAENDYAGSLHVSGSGFAPDNKTVPVTAHITTQPIAAWTPLQFKAVQGSAASMQQVAFTNSGMGMLALSSASTTASWLTPTTDGTTLKLAADPAGLSPGAHLATVTVQSNAKNSPSIVTVEMDVSAPRAPWTYFGGVLDNALFKAGDPVSPGDILAMFGEQFTAQAPALVSRLPLETSMDGATVYVNDQPAPLYYVSAGQIDFALPYGTQSGTALVRVDQNGQRGNSVSIKVQPAVPRLLQLPNGYANATLADNVTFPMPVTAGVPSRPAQAGVDTIVFYAIGLGQTTPPASDGQAAPAGQIGPSKIVFSQGLFGGIVSVTPAYAGLSPGSVGLYQVNVLVPQNSPKGSTVAVYLDMGNGVLSNSVKIAVQ